MKIFHLNIRSFHKNSDQLALSLAQLDGEFDVLILTETFFIHDIGLFNLPGYTTFYSEGKLNCHDGVLVFIKRDIPSTHEIVKIGGIEVLQINFLYLGAEFIGRQVHRRASSMRDCSSI